MVTTPQSQLNRQRVRHHGLALSFCAVIGVALVGCTTPRYKEFAGVKPGMEKDLVIEQAGGPNVSRRAHGKDRWIYNYVSTPNGPQSKEVHFENGRAVFVGDKPIPKISAEQQDRVNDDSNQKEAARDAAQVARWNDEHGVANQLKTGNQLDRQDLRIQRSMYGTSPTVERSFVAPRYESID